MSTLDHCGAQNIQAHGDSRTGIKDQFLTMEHLALLYAHPTIIIAITVQGLNRQIGIQWLRSHQ